MNEIIEFLQLVMEMVNEEVPPGILLNTYSLDSKPIVTEFSILNEGSVLIVIDETGIFLADSSSDIERTCSIKTTVDIFEQMFMGTLSPLDAIFYNTVYVEGSIKDLISIVDLFNRFNNLYDEILRV